MSHKRYTILRLLTITLFVGLLCRTFLFAEADTIYISILQGLYEVVVITLCIRQHTTRFVDLSSKSFLGVGLHLLLPMLFKIEAASSPFGSYPAVLCIVGTAFAVVSLIDLNRFFGVLPAFRGMRSSGMYRFIRHPAYAGYLVAMLGATLSLFSFFNVCVFLTYIAATLYRISLEENLLLTYSDEYQEYTRRVQDRLIPGVY